MAKIETIRHSLAHIMASAVKNLYPKTKFGMGPDTENGFYYDFDFPKNQKISIDDLGKIEKEMKRIIKEEIVFNKSIISKEKAKQIFKEEKYKLEIIKEIANKKVTIYQSGNFIDLCSGPHIKSSKEIQPDSFKLIRVAGAYFKGDEKREMLTRIYGLAFENREELEKYINFQKEAEKRDHRLLGQKLDLFLIDEKIGLGLPIWLPKGMIVRKEIENYLYKELSKDGYDWIYTPHIGSRKLWEKSGHWNFYNDSMYPTLEVGQSLEDFQKGKKAKIKEEYLLKPMNCPFHTIVYNSKIRSYKNLPIKIAEFGNVYRYERSGTLHGLTRVRGFTQDDAHLICTPEQMPNELKKLLKQGLSLLESFGFKKYNIYLSTRPEKYTGSLKRWKEATNTLEKILKDSNLKYSVDKGGGVFYGPKIDIKIKDSLNREWQCTTIQFDFNLPERFKMKYVDEKGKEKEPYMIHRALIGSMERFFGVLLEHYSAALPLWLSPIQVEIINIGEKHKDYVEEIYKKMIDQDIRAKVNTENLTLGKKIREAETQRIPYIVIIGDKEIQNKEISVRKRAKGNIGSIKIDKFIEQIKEEKNKKE